MPQLDLKINDRNVSAQVGDTVYYCKVNVDTDGLAVGGFNISNYNDIVKIGKITAIGFTTIRVNIEGNINLPSASDYIFFSKENKVNTGDLKGYFAEVKFENNSSEKAEMFQVTMDVEQSSK